MLSELHHKVKLFYEQNKRDLYISAVIFLIGLIGFGLGRLSAIVPQKAPLTVHEEQEPVALPASSSEKERGSACEAGTCSTPETAIVASKNGSAYYFPWCSNSIKEENEIFFASEDEAKSAGYRLARNCSK